MSFVNAAVSGAIGLGGALIQGRAASKAADSQADSSAASLQLQREMFDRQDALGKWAVKAQQKTANTNAMRGFNAAAGASADARRQAEGLYGPAAARATATSRENIGDFTRERDKGASRIGAAADASIQPFMLQSKLGNNALRAYSSNLGVGTAPDGYNFEMTPGNRYLLDEGGKAVEGGAAARGGLYSGAAMEELQRHAMGIAAQDRGQQQAELFQLGGLGQSAAGTMANIRTGAAGDINALRGGYTGQIAGQRSGLNDQLYQYGSNRANALTNASDTLAARRIGVGDTHMSGLGQARSVRSQLGSSTAMNFGTNGGNSIVNRGEAQAGGAIGVGNAIAGGINTGFGTYGAMGGKFPWQQPQQQQSLKPNWSQGIY